MRRAAVAATMAAACVAGAATAKSGDAYQVFDHQRLVLTFRARPGVLTSSALPAPGTAPVRHPFISGSARAPDEEDRLRAILDRSKSAQDFIDRLRRAGFVVRGPEPPQR